MSRPLIKLTSAQKAELEKQKSANPEDRRVHLPLTEEQQRQIRAAAEQEQAQKAENIAALRRGQAAELEPTLSGDLRRAINAASRRPYELADDIGVSRKEFDAFRSGDATLPSDVIDRLAQVLGLTLHGVSTPEEP